MAEVKQEASESLSVEQNSSRRAFSAHVFWTFGARLLMATNSVLASVIVARWLGTDGIGALSVISVMVTTSVQVASFGVPGANTYFIARDLRHLAPATFNSMLFALFGGSAFALGVWLVTFFNPVLLANMPSKVIAVSIAAVPFQLATLLGTNIFLALGRVARYNLLDLLNQSFVIINAILAVIILKAGLLTLVLFNTAASAGVSLLVGVLLYQYVRKHRRMKMRDVEFRNGRCEMNAPDNVKWRADVRLFARMAHYSFKSHIWWMATVIIYRVDLLIVNHFRGASEAGVYAVASQAALMLMLLPTVISQLLFSRVAATQDKGGALTCLVARHTAFILFIACLLSVPGSLILPVLYGAAFNDVPLQLWILLPGIYFIGLQSVLVQYFVGMGLPRLVPTMWIMTLVINITLNLMFVPVFGARGAAVISTISYTLIFVAVFLYFRICTRTAFADIFLLRQDELRRLFIFNPLKRAPVR